MAKSKKWEDKPVVNGYVEVHIKSWRYFYEFMHREMVDYRTYIWRGQRCDNWSLESTLDRLIKTAKVAARKIPGFRTSHLDQFKQATRGRRGPNPPKLENDNDWWALGQHFGLATPLLDWTKSPFVAAYFAYIGTGQSQTRNRAIYALHRPSVTTKVNELFKAAQAGQSAIEKSLETQMSKPGGLRSLPVTLGESSSTSEPVSLRTLASGLGASPPTSNYARGLASLLAPQTGFSPLRELARLGYPIRPEVEFISPQSDENQRLVTQSGLFTRAPDNVTLDAWVQENFAEDTEGWTLVKILLPNKDRDECLKELNRMNINHLSLFPDLFGASKYCNLYGEVERY